MFFLDNNLSLPYGSIHLRYPARNKRCLLVSAGIPVEKSLTSSKKRDEHYLSSELVGTYSPAQWLVLPIQSVEIQIPFLTLAALIRLRQSARSVGGLRKIPKNPHGFKSTYLKDLSTSKIMRFGGSIQIK